MYVTRIMLSLIKMQCRQLSALNPVVSTLHKLVTLHNTILTMITVIHACRKLMMFTIIAIITAWLYAPWLIERLLIILISSYICMVIGFCNISLTLKSDVSSGESGVLMLL